MHAALTIAKSLGADGGLSGVIGAADDVLNVGNSGILLRFVTALVAQSAHPFVITGDETVRNRRPMHDLVRALVSLGVEITSLPGTGRPPFLIRGPMRPGFARLSGHDSQPVSALLIASAFGCGETTIAVQNPGEIPFVAMTLDWFDRLGLRYVNDNYRRYEVVGGQRIAPFSYRVPGDLSSMAFPLTAAIASGSAITIHGVDLSDCQGDKKILDHLQAMGADITASADAVTIRPQHLRGIEVNINDCIDTVASLAVVGCFAEGKTVLRGAGVAREKESNRLATLARELGKMGASIREIDDGLEIVGCALHGAVVESANDHRVAMALASAGLGAKGETHVLGSACVKKTYPGFCAMLQQLGAAVVEV